MSRHNGSDVAALTGLLSLALAASAAIAEPQGASPPAPPQAATPGSNLSTPASGDLIISGDPHALACQDAAKLGDFHSSGIEDCTLALGSPLLSQHDLAATHTDRGAVYLQHGQFAQAKADFDTALTLEPAMANAYIDRGGALIAMKRYAEAIADIDHGLALGPDQPEKAYFNRAIADQHLKDLKAAYQDYLKASQLNPNWAAPKAELERLAP